MDRGSAVADAVVLFLRQSLVGRGQKEDHLRESGKGDDVRSGEAYAFRVPIRRNAHQRKETR
jgi:hypothetical protein